MADKKNSGITIDHDGPGFLVCFFDHILILEVGFDFWNHFNYFKINISAFFLIIALFEDFKIYFSDISVLVEILYPYTMSLFLYALLLYNG